MRRGLTLMELVIVMAIMGVLCAVGIPSLLRFLDRSRVRHAANEIVTTLGVARSMAIARQSHVSTGFNAVRSAIAVTIGNDTVLSRELGSVYGVSVRSNRDSTVYGPTGLGYGAANQTIVVRRGAAADSVVVSRLGRVRH